MSKQITGFRPGSKKWKKFMAKLYGIGAAVVIVGALFKIQHWPGASAMLVAGLGTEAVIFFFSAFDPLHEDPDWTLVYPELAVPDEDELESIEHLEESSEVAEEPAYAPEGTITEQLDNMLEEAKIGPELIESLGTGLRSLSDQAGSLNDMTEAATATNDYVSNVKSASESVGQLRDSYQAASESLTSIASSTEDGAAYSEQLQKISQNLSELNSVYELQLQGSQTQLESTNKLFGGIHEMLENLNASIDDTKRYREGISELSENLNSLNTVYGNMLTAMGGTPNRNQG